MTSFVFRRICSSFISLYNQQLTKTVTRSTKILSTAANNGNSMLVTKATPCYCGFVQVRMKTKKAKVKQKADHPVSSKVDLSLADGIIDLVNIKHEMESIVQKLKDDFKHKYATKLTLGTIDQISVSIDNNNLQLYEVASVASSNKEFTVTPMMEGSNVLKQLLNSIQNTGLNLNPRIDGTVIRIPISIASSDYKQSLCKLCKASAEKCRTQIRKCRQQGLVELKKVNDTVSQDVARLIEKQIQQLTDHHIALVDQTLQQKEGELNL